MYQFSKAEGECMLNLAREAITTLLNTGKPYTCAPESLMAEVREVHAAFVTLTMDGALRGCIGHIEAIQPLYLDIIENACNAALRDPRFSPVNKAEFENIVVEVSVMRPFEPFDYASCDALIEKLTK